MRCTEQRKMPDFVVSPKSWFALLLFLHGYALCQALTEEPNSVIKILKYLLQTILSNGQTNADVDDPLQSGTTQANNSGEDFAQSNSSYCDTECRVHRLQGLDIKVNKESPSVWVHDLSNVKHGNWNVIFPEILEDSLQQNIENISVNTSKPSLLSLGCRGPPCAQCIGSNCDSPALSVPDCNPYLLYGLSLPLDSPHITIYWRPEAAYGLTLTLDKNREDVKVPENDRNRTHRIDIKTREKYVQVDIPSLHRGIILEREEVENAFIKIESWGQSSRWILRCNIATTETTTLIANTNQGSTNISSGNLQEDFGLSQNNTKATAKKMISDLKEVSLLPSDIQRAVDALTALEKEFEKELNLTENGRALELAKEYTADVIEVSGKVLEKPSPWQELAEADRGRASGKVQATVASAAVKVAELLSNRTEDFETENIHILVSSRPANVTTRRYDHVHYPNTYIELPELFYRGYVGEDNNVRVVFISYTTLHSVTNTIPLDPKQASPGVFPAKGQVNSGIINAIVGQKGLWRAGEGEATAVKFGHVYNGEEFLLANASCVWWDEAANAWNTSGCTLNYTDAHVTICRCNHLTSLALLMDVRGFLAKERVRENPAYLAGKWLTILACSASAICLVLSIACILALKQLRETTCWKTRCHLCVSLLFVQLLVMGLDATERRWLCLSVAVSLHFAMLSAFTWGAIESFNMYMKFGKVWRSQRSLVKFYVGVGYGFPAVVVSTTLGVSKTEGYYTETTCWLAPGAMMWTFFGIVALILAINLLAFVLVMRLVITRMMKSPQPAGPNGKGQADRIWGTLTIFLVLGLTWLTGILYAVFGSTSLAFVFILTNSLQGVWIFIFGIVMNRRVRGDAVKLMLSWRKGRYEIEPSVRFTTSHTIDSQVDAGK